MSLSIGKLSPVWLCFVKSLVVETRSSPVNEGNEGQKAWIFSNDNITQNFTYNIISLPAVWIPLIW
jgi:hypothetical protein